MSYTHGIVRFGHLIHHSTISFEYLYLSVGWSCLPCLGTSKSLAYVFGERQTQSCALGRNMT